METIKYSKKDIKLVKEDLLNGKIIAFPTDTVFGLGCVINKDAIAKIYEAKGRSFDKPLPMMCNGLEMIESVAHVSDEAKKIINKFVPGALTLIFNKKENIKDYVTNGKPTIGIRVPDDNWILELINKLDQPILVTSANLSDTGSLLKWEDVYAQLNGKIDGIVCEDATGQTSSTIIDVTSELKVLRQGPITIDEIKEALKC